jgi:hypothetical protein
MVPMAIHELLDMSPDERGVAIRAWSSPDVADVIAGNGDMVLHGAVKRTAAARRESAAALTTTARALAALAFLPGGATAFGTNWCAVHSPAGRRSDGLPCVSCLRRTANP